MGFCGLFLASTDNGVNYFETFKANESKYANAATVFYLNGKPSEAMIQYICGITDGNATETLAGLGNLWADALTDVNWWVNLGFAALAPEAKFEKLTISAKTAFSTIKSTSTVLLKPLANLSYRIKVVATEVALYSNLNIEIARFNANGIIKPNSWLMIPLTSEYRLIQTFDEAPYIDLQGGTSWGKLELYENTNEKSYSWKITAKNLAKTGDVFDLSAFKKEEKFNHLSAALKLMSQTLDNEALQREELLEDISRDTQTELYIALAIFIAILIVAVL